MSASDARRARRRAERQQANSPRPYPRKQPGERIGMHLAPAVAHNQPASIQDMCRITHDDLIARLGDRRRSGVQWSLVEGRERCNGWLDDYAKATGQPPEAFAEYRVFIADVDDCVLVVAACEVVQ